MDMDMDVDMERKLNCGCYNKACNSQWHLRHNTQKEKKTYADNPGLYDYMDSFACDPPPQIVTLLGVTYSNIFRNALNQLRYTIKFEGKEFDIDPNYYLALDCVNKKVVYVNRQNMRIHSKNPEWKGVGDRGQFDYFYKNIKTNERVMQGGKYWI